MIIIPRKRNEAVVVGEDIVVTVLEIRGDKVRLGIDFPDSAAVQRGEASAAMHPTPVEPRCPS